MIQTRKARDPAALCEVQHRQRAHERARLSAERARTRVERANPPRQPQFLQLHGCIRTGHRLVANALQTPRLAPCRGLTLVSYL